MSRPSRAKFIGNGYFLGLLCMGIFMALLIGSQFHFPGTLLLAAEYSKPQGWDQLVEAARKEGVVSMYGAEPASEPPFVDAFKKAYPGIKVMALAIPGRVAISKLGAEYRARKHLVDVVISTTPIVLKPMGLYAPLKPALMLPEVLDPKAWWGNRLWWYDAARPYTMLNFQGIAQAYVSYNTKLVDPNQFNSWKDLLNPKWKGKIVSIDPRRSPNAGDAIHLLYNHPDLGPSYMERFFGEMVDTFSANSRQMVDWVARGRYHLAFAAGSRTTGLAAAQGLSIALLMTQRFKEGATMNSSGGGIALMKHAPHPNAAKLYINWFLSRRGQIAWQKVTEQNSLRVDIPKDGLRPENTPIPGRQYIFTSTEKLRRDRKPAIDFIRALIDRRIRQRGK